MVLKFISTSKVSFPGSGIAALAASEANLEDAKKYMRVQTIGHDKLNQLRHVRFFKDMQGMYAHMRKHADIDVYKRQDLYLPSDHQKVN